VPDETRDPSAGALVRDLSEEQLLGRIVPLLPVGAATLLPPGDDAAVVASPDGRFVVTTDVLVEDRHFRRAWSTGFDVGARAAVQNLADVEAMGALPTALVVALAVPGDLPVAWVEGLARGLAHVCEPLGVGVVGGDLSGGPVGDVVAHAGVVGRSAAGLALLTAGLGDVDADAVAGYLRPTSPWGAGPLAAAAGATAMLDVSDGLLRDGGRLGRASGVVVDLDPDAFGPDVAALAGPAAALGADPLEWVLGGGEDHGLLATFPAGAAVPAPFRVVGAARAGEPGVLVGGRPSDVRAGWDHCAG
jgi:thiamine-monophosphate kinase